MTLALALILTYFQDFPCFGVFFDLTQFNRYKLSCPPRLWVVPHFSSGIVGRAKRKRAWKSPHARKGDTQRGGNAFSRVGWFSRALAFHSLYYPWWKMLDVHQTCVPFSYSLSLLWHSTVTNSPNITFIFHDFPGPTIKFHDFSRPGKKMKFLNFMTFQVFHNWTVRTLQCVSLSTILIYW